MSIPYLATLLKVLAISKGPLEFPMNGIVLATKRDIELLFLSAFLLFPLLFLLLSPRLQALFNGKRESRDLCVLVGSSGNIVSFSLLHMMLAIGLSCRAFL